MALGRYLSTRSEQDVYYTAWQKEQYEIINNSDLECQESIEILINQGMSHQDASNYITILKQYPDLWTKWMMDNELEIPDIRNAKPLLQSLITLCSFIFFGTIPLAPYIFWNSG
jgi:VIT1/CCC1 family predicted Fe2+/Mn2+ transporter